MNGLCLQEIARIVGGQLVHDRASTRITGVTTDSRSVQKGQLFVALRGKRFDGHHFVPEAIQKGALAAMVSHKLPLAYPQIIVRQPLRAMGRLAQAYRMALKAKVIAVTGSCGKTTTKEMIAHILGCRYRVVHARASYNNAVGVPLTILEAGEDTDFLVLEIGANKRGEIARLAQIAYPDTAVLTCVARAHLEGFGSLEGVAREKSQLTRYLRSGGFAVINRDSELLRKFVKLPAEKVITTSMFSSAAPADVHPDEIRDLQGAVEFRIRGVRFRVNMYGLWNISNALLAIAVCTAYGASLEECAERLATFRPPRMRMERLSIDGVTIINDAYNSNPDSAENALREFDKMPGSGRRIAVIGDMAELGRHSARSHAELGRLIMGLPNIDMVVAVGKEMRHAVKQMSGGRTVKHFATSEEASDFIAQTVRPGDLLLLKGSRCVGLEKILEDWVRRERPLAAAANQ